MNDLGVSQICIGNIIAHVVTCANKLCALGARIIRYISCERFFTVIELNNVLSITYTIKGELPVVCVAAYVRRRNNSCFCRKHSDLCRKLVSSIVFIRRSKICMNSLRNVLIGLWVCNREPTTFVVRVINISCFLPASVCLLFWHNWLLFLIKVNAGYFVVGDLAMRLTESNPLKRNWHWEWVAIICLYMFSIVTCGPNKSRWGAVDDLDREWQIKLRNPGLAINFESIGAFNQWCSVASIWYPGIDAQKCEFSILFFG